MYSSSRYIHYIALAGCMLASQSFLSCRSSEKVVSVKGDMITISSEWDHSPDNKALAIVAPFKAKVDSIMSPVIGESEMNMEAKRPESLLSNLIADVLRDATIPHIGHPADLGIINIGGLRSSLNKGKITFGNVYEILPFQNTLCIVYIKGKNLKELMQNIVSVGGEGVSNLELIANKQEIVSVKIGGKPIDDEHIYEVATVDYLAEGNDKMIALQKAERKEYIATEAVRDLFLKYIKALHAEGKGVTSRIEGRIQLNN
ncbi:5'-nucleotidase C-terminal domain-containing protein [Bacteroides sp. 224]|uniref:5'-nucleotidase C-terminal domain-containing protein n=1 Tax=Bacteroides sp. 224 TaxID=2302936 RepID=UPI0013D87494|nr:5'-nucleotidase [Bacteroides sp. 224]NDV64041.1 5'-nucleotidase [Bacteroides sp. 224]